MPNPNFEPKKTEGFFSRLRKFVEALPNYSRLIRLGENPLKTRPLKLANSNSPREQREPRETSASGTRKNFASSSTLNPKPSVGDVVAGISGLVGAVSFVSGATMGLLNPALQGQLSYFFYAFLLGSGIFIVHHSVKMLRELAR